MDKLKSLLLRGAPYLHKKDDDNYAMTHTAFYSRTDIIEIIRERHKNEKTLDDEDEFQHQTCLALYTICSTNCGDIARALPNVDTPVIPQKHLNEAAATGSTAVLNEILTFSPEWMSTLRMVMVTLHCIKLLKTSTLTQCSIFSIRMLTPM
ncbi:hypothetical protein LOD99_2918 [Oopsacas minuta]|uniref:Uncharacterized protein n=1 Tax=Oopsacas minuta TaxID=111878 RepID=A0AAV7K1D4_9METZ|nr:hypothetical protein LOD99_2918 [Oopsacas minuta]